MTNPVRSSSPDAAPKPESEQELVDAEVPGMRRQGPRIPEAVPVSGTPQPESAIITELREVIRTSHRAGYRHGMGPCVCVYCEDKPLPGVSAPQPESEVMQPVSISREATATAPSVAGVSVTEGEALLECDQCGHAPQSWEAVAGRAVAGMVCARHYEDDGSCDGVYRPVEQAQAVSVTPPQSGFVSTTKITANCDLGRHKFCSGCECQCHGVSVTEGAVTPPGEAERLASEIDDWQCMECIEGGVPDCEECGEPWTECDHEVTFCPDCKALRDAAALLRSQARELEEAQKALSMAEQEWGELREQLEATDEEKLKAIANFGEWKLVKDSKIAELSRQLEEAKADVDWWQRMTGRAQDSGDKLADEVGARRTGMERLQLEVAALRTQLSEARTENERLKQRSDLLSGSLYEAARIIEGQSKRSPFVAVEEWRVLLSNGEVSG